MSAGKEQRGEKKELRVPGNIREGKGRNWECRGRTERGQEGIDRAGEEQRGERKELRVPGKNRESKERN